MPEIKCPRCGTVFTVDENEYKGIVEQIRNDEFEKELRKREESLKKESDAILKLQQERANSEKERALFDLKTELEKVKSDNKTLRSEKELEIAKAVNEKDKEILKLKNQIELNQKEAKLEIDNISKEHQVVLKQKDEQIEFYRDMKAKLSTKMIGESLEQHCLTEFNKIRATAFPNAYFEKDNEVIEHGKGDFVFRDKTNDGIEFISIMFEMKNQNDDGDKKHKNEEFFKKLEEDRQKKGCEYAVLVSLLEPESELYNQGIVDVSYKYKNMYVIRPQFFIPMITLLRNAAIKNIDARRELTVYQQQNYDLVNFERNLREYKEDFSSNVMRAGKNFTDAINEIEKSIKELEKTKENLLKSAHQLSIADKKVQGITIKKLTKDAPSIQSAFDELNKDEN